MATYTPNYNFKKPDRTDTVNISDLNGNMDALDSELKSVSDRVDAAPVIEVGYIAVASIAANSSRTGSETYTATFPNVARVQLTPIITNGNSTGVTCCITAQSTTGFSWTIKNDTSTSKSVGLSWIAIR